MTPSAYCVHRRFEASPLRPFRMDRHYFLYALEGSLRLEADGQRWILPPARGALIAADHEINVEVRGHLVSASVLFDRSMFTPKETLSVFDMSPLARELVRACREWGPESEVSAFGQHLFTTLGLVLSRLAEVATPCVLPLPSSDTLRRAVDLTEEAMATSPDFREIARAVGQSPRSLARRFSDEMGMSWRDTLRRLRTLRAVEHLAESDAPVTMIALDVGYSSVSAFNAGFRDLMGQSPTEYRKSLTAL